MRRPTATSPLAFTATVAEAFPPGPRARAWRVPAAALRAAVPVPLLVPAALLAAWQLASSRGWVAEQILPSPASVAETLVTLARSGELWGHLRASLSRVAAGYALAAGAGLAGGALLGLSRTAEAALGTIFKAYAQTPVIAWVPLGILVFGIEDRLLVALIAMAAVVPVLLGAWHGVRGVPPAWLEVARVYGLSGWRLALRVVAPAALPQALTGLRYGLNQAWLTLVAAELVGTTEGLGYLIVEARELFQLDVVLAAIAVLGATGLVLDRLFSSLESRLLSWRPRGF